VKKKLVVGIVTIFFFTVVAGIYVYGIEDELEKHAKKEAITLISDLHELDEDLIRVDSTSLEKEYGSYAISLIDQHLDDEYQVAVILNEEQTDIDFTIDVTGTFDKYGLAYCH
jgi:hypothetical protein